MRDGYEDLKELLSELNLVAVNLFINLYCNECNLSLEDYGYEPLVFGENDVFADNTLCGKCAADYYGEEDYHSERFRDKNENIIFEPNDDKRKARIRGMQTTVYEVLKSLASGMTERDIFKKFPRLTHKDILACLDFAAEREKSF